MAFDINGLAASLGSGNPLTAVGTSFGMPSCLLNLAAEALALLPSPLLAYLNELAAEAAARAQEFLSELLDRLFYATGILAFDSENGLFRFFSDSSVFGLFNEIGAIVASINGVLAAGAALYNAAQNLIAQVQEIIDCLNSFLNGPGGPYAPDLEPASEQRQRYDALAALEFQRYLAQLNIVRDTLNDITDFQDNVNRAQITKQNNGDIVVPPEFSGLGYPVATSSTTDADVLRLVFGPPKTSEGQYVLSVDGLYYDSQTDQGIEPVLIFLRARDRNLNIADKWKFDHLPSLGGKGDQVKSTTFSKWLNSIFDINVIDDSQEIRRYYEKDHFLKVLVGNKEKRVLDLSSYISQLEVGGQSKAIVDNFKQALLSEVAYHEDKIRRRKKQIEIAAKVSSTFGRQNPYAPGKIPINDFSYLQDCNISLALDKQKQLVLRQDEVSGVVLPIRPTFVVATPNFGVDSELDYLTVPRVGIGAIITDSSGVSDPSAVELSLDDVIVTDQLISVYNYLNSNIEVYPSSLNYTVLNCATDDNYNNAQLVGSTQENVFSLGLASVYLEGITKNNGTSLSGVGSYVKLPDTPEYQDWLYNLQGASFQAWVHVPNLSSTSSWYNNDASSLYRLVLASENTGTYQEASRTEDILSVKNDRLGEFTRGLIAGFTRDRRWTQDTLPSNVEDENSASSAGFLIAPTISYDQSSIAFITKDCSIQDGLLGMFIPASATTASGKKLFDVANQFCDIAFTFDYKKDTLSVFLDSELLATSSIVDSFGVPRFSPLKLPSAKFKNSFEYTASTVGETAPAALKSGPKLYPFFTPWILGGGYTDGMALRGNFMGGEYGGISSGLRGYLGSTKFYSKVLTPQEVIFNYTIQSKLYKNIILD